MECQAAGCCQLEKWKEEKIRGGIGRGRKEKRGKNQSRDETTNERKLGNDSIF